jgi:hypothetical protein
MSILILYIYYGGNNLYCYTYLNNFSCVLNELLLWSDISSEHPIFIKTVAELTKKNLPEEVLDKLMEVNKMFSELKGKTEELKKQMHFNPYNPYNYLTQIKIMVKEFLMHDRYALQVIDMVKRYGQEDKVWQTLLEHITEEQEFMYKLFNDLDGQLNQFVNV